MWHGCAKDLSVFSYNTMSRKIIGGVYMVMNGIYFSYSLRVYSNFSVPLFMGLSIAVKVLTLDQYRPTPAMVHNDGHDYVPTNKWVTLVTLQPLLVQALS